MEQVNVHEAKTRLSQLLEAVGQGATVVIAKAGKPVAQLSAVERPLRKPGYLRGRIKIASDFDAPLPETELAVLEGR